MTEVGIELSSSDTESVWCVWYKSTNSWGTMCIEISKQTLLAFHPCWLIIGWNCISRDTNPHSSSPFLSISKCSNQWGVVPPVPVPHSHFALHFLHTGPVLSFCRSGLVFLDSLGPWRILRVTSPQQPLGQS